MVLTPTGYYLQLSVHTLILEMADCMAVSDATFMVSLFVLPRFLLFYSAKIEDRKFKQLRVILEPQCFLNRNAYVKCSCECCSVCVVGSLLAVFLVVLFSFAESGFFAPDGRSRFLLVWSLILKLMLGLRLIFVAGHDKHEQLRKVIDDGDDGDRAGDRQKILDNEYQHDTLDLDTRMNSYLQDDQAGDQDNDL